MRIISFKNSGGEDVREYKAALKEAKRSLERAHEAVETICELSEEMEDEYSERGDYSRYSNRGYYRRDDRDWDEMHERRYRDSMGRYR